MDHVVGVEQDSEQVSVCVCVRVRMRERKKVCTSPSSLTLHFTHAQSKRDAGTSYLRARHTRTFIYIKGKRDHSGDYAIFCWKRHPARTRGQDE